MRLDIVLGSTEQIDTRLERGLRVDSGIVAKVGLWDGGAMVRGSVKARVVLHCEFAHEGGKTEVHSGIGGFGEDAAVGGAAELGAGWALRDADAGGCQCWSDRKIGERTYCWNSRISNLSSNPFRFRPNLIMRSQSSNFSSVP